MGCCTCKRNDPLFISRDIIVNTFPNEIKDQALSTKEISPYNYNNSQITNNIKQDKTCLKTFDINVTENINQNNDLRKYTKTYNKRVKDTAKKLKQITVIEVKNVNKFFFKKIVYNFKFFFMLIKEIKSYFNFICSL